MRNLKMLLNTSLNIAVPVLLVLCALHYYVRWQGKQRAIASAIQLPESPHIGGSLPVINGKSHGVRGTVVLVTSTTCSYSKLSMPLYREMSARIREDGDWHLIVLGDRRDDRLEAWVRGNGIEPHDVVQTDLATTGAWGTPMLIVVDPQGTITDLANGGLTPDGEASLWDRLDGKPTTLQSFVAPSWDARIVAAKHPQVIDIRDRETAARAPVRAGIHIPVDELMRARFELSADRPVLIDCHMTPGVCYSAAVALHSDGFEVGIRLQPIVR